MASLSRPRPLSLVFMLFVLCLHHCSARKVLKNDLKPEAAPSPSDSQVDGKLPSSEISDPIDVQCGDQGCGTPCFQEPCGPDYEIVPQPPHTVNPPAVYVPTPPQIVPQPPHLYFPPPIVVPTPPEFVPITKPPCSATPCEPWYGPGPCPCQPCEEGTGAADKDGVKPEANDNNNKARGQKRQDSAKQADEPKMADAPAPAPASYSNDGGYKLLV